MRRPVALLAAVLAAIGLTACGIQRDVLRADPARDQALSLELDSAPSAEHSGIYAAASDGEFAQAGLKVAIRAPGDGTDPLRELEAGKVTVAISSEPQLMLARDANQSVLAFGALVQRPLTSIISLRSKHVSSPRALRGKTVGTSGVPYERAELSAILRRAGVPQRSVKVSDVGHNLVSATLADRVDATIGGHWNAEAIALRRQHRRIDVTPVNDAGVPTYDDLVFVTTETFFANHTSELRRFVQAVGRGYAQVRADPQLGLRALTRADPSLEAGLQRASLQATLPAEFPSGGHPWGWQDQHEWNVFGRWMTRQGLISGIQAWADVSTNQLLAGQGP